MTEKCNYCAWPDITCNNTSEWRRVYVYNKLQYETERTIEQCLEEQQPRLSNIIILDKD